MYFPVFVSGALIHVGDGHAIQGDGEIVGTGIEISMDIQFTARVIKGKRIGWPRGENADYIFTVLVKHIVDRRMSPPAGF